MTKTNAKTAMKITRTYYNDGFMYDGSYKAHTIRYFKKRGRKTARRTLNNAIKKATED